MNSQRPEKVAFVMVGLPARGKSFMARKLVRYLNWLGFRSRVFNVGAYRRERIGSHQPHSFFDPDNEEANAARGKLAEEALRDLLDWLQNEGDVALYDATNSTVARRTRVRMELEKHGVRVVFLESICNDPQILEANIRQTKARSPDYEGVAPEQAIEDFRRRIAHYERMYEPVQESEGSHLKIIDVARTVVAHRIEGYVPSRVVSVLLNMHLEPRSLWLTRHGESEYNLENRVGGDPSLSPSGAAYAQRLGTYIASLQARPIVWTSTLRRTIETARGAGLQHREWRALDEIDAGICDGLTYQEIATQLPAEAEARAKDKFRYRYPRGESYQDVIQRLEPLILELERERSPVLVISHQAVLRTLYAYLVGLPPEKCPMVSVPLHTVLRLTPSAYGCDEQRILLPPDVAATNALASEA